VQLPPQLRQAAGTLAAMQDDSAVETDRERVNFENKLNN